ncbi:Ribonuclease H2 subunit A [Chamberlinius hualienensis]
MEFQSFFENVSMNKVFESDVPLVTKEKPCMLGIDEAGRGPVLGPMVYSICYCPIDELDRLKSLKFADSKVLTESQRESLFDGIKQANDFIGWMVDVISPNHISCSMLKRCKYNLNAISHDAAIALIRKLIEKNICVKEIYVDTVGDPAKYQKKLKDLFPDIDVTVAKKADSTYPIVSAASICAKVARDYVVSNWKFKENLEQDSLSWGSGYPGDPVTKSFLEKNLDPVFGYPQFVRFSWSTADKMLEKKAYPVVWEECDEEEKGENIASVMSYFKRVPANEKLDKMHAYFSDRCLKKVTSL